MFKKAQTGAYIVGAIAVIIVIVVIALNVSQNSVKTTGSVVSEGITQKNCKKIETSYEIEEEYLKSEYYTETVPYTDTICETEELPYSIDNFVINYDTCNEVKKECESCWYGACNCVDYCVDRSLSCSLDLRNLDDEEQGSWTMKFIFYERGTSNEIKAKEVSLFIYPQTTKTFTGTVRIQSEGKEGDANKELSCKYHRINLATKQVCEEVTRYKEVQREKQVTAYRPATKYKTETICN